MSHKAGHIIIQSLMDIPTLSAEERMGLMVLSTRLEEKGSLSTAERMSLAWLVYKLAKD